MFDSAWTAELWEREWKCCVLTYKGGTQLILRKKTVEDTRPSVKESIQENKQQLTEWEEISAKPVSDKDLVSRIYNQHLQLKNKKQTSQLKNW